MNDVPPACRATLNLLIRPAARRVAADASSSAAEADA